MLTFVLQVLSKVAVEEVFMHYFEKKCCQLFGFASDPHKGYAPRPRSRTSVLDLLVAHPWKNPAGAHIHIIIIITFITEHF